MVSPRSAYPQERVWYLLIIPGPHSWAARHHPGPLLQMFPVKSDGKSCKTLICSKKANKAKVYTPCVCVCWKSAVSIHSAFYTIEIHNPSTSVFPSLLWRNTSRIKGGTSENVRTLSYLFSFLVPLFFLQKWCVVHTLDSFLLKADNFFFLFLIIRTVFAYVINVL